MPGKIYSASVFSSITPLVSLLLFFFISALGVRANAENIKNLYDSRVLIQSSRSLEAADSLEPNNSPEKAEAKQRLLIEKAFINVLYKVTGSKEFLVIKDSKKLLASGQNLVQKFGYENQIIGLNGKNNVDKKAEETQVKVSDSLSTTETPATQDDTFNPDKTSLTSSGELKVKPAEQKTQKVFWVRFNQQATDRVLKEYGLPVWDSLRPDTLIWLSIEENRQRSILTPAISPQPFDVIQKQAAVRGVSLKIPFGDLEDKNRLSIADLWGNFSNAILAASQRYHSQAVLAVRVFQEPSGLWIGNWSLYILGENANWQIRNENLNILLAQGIDRLADNLASRFAVQVADEQQNKLLIQVNNVVDFEGYLKVKNYFAKLPAVKRSTLLATYADSLIYEIEYLSNENHLLQTLNLGNILQKVENSPVKGQSGQLEYTPVILDDGVVDKTPPIVASNQSLPVKDINNTESSTHIAKSQTPQANLQNRRTELENMESEEEQNKNSLPTPEVEYWLVN